MIQVVHEFPVAHESRLQSSRSSRQFTDKTPSALDYVGTTGRDLVNCRDLNACPVSSSRRPESSRQPYGARFPQYDHILQLTTTAIRTTTACRPPQDAGYSRLHRPVNYTWSTSLRHRIRQSRWGPACPTYQNPYRRQHKATRRPTSTHRGTSISPSFMTCQKFTAYRTLIGEGWSINSLFRAQDGRPFSVPISAAIPPTKDCVRLLRGLHRRAVELSLPHQ